MFISTVTPAQTDFVAEARWAAQLASHLNRALGVPASGDATGVAFRIDRNGRVSDVRVVQPTGDAEVDRRAVARLRAIGALPAGPDGAAPRTELAMIGADRTASPLDRADAAPAKREIRRLSFA